MGTFDGLDPISAFASRVFGYSPYERKRGSSVNAADKSDEIHSASPRSNSLDNEIEISFLKRKSVPRRKFWLQQRQYVDIAATQDTLQQAVSEARHALQQLNFAGLPSALREEGLEIKMHAWPDQLAEVVEAFEENLPALSVDADAASENDIERDTDHVKKFNAAIKILQCITEEVKGIYHLVKEQSEFTQKSLLVGAISALLTCIGAALGLLSYFVPLVAPFTAIVGPTISLTSAVGGFGFQVHAHRNEKYLKAWEDVITSLEALEMMILGEKAVLPEAIDRLTNSFMQKTEARLSAAEKKSAEKIASIEADVIETKKNLQTILQQNQSLEQKVTLLEENNTHLLEENDRLKSELSTLIEQEK